MLWLYFVLALSGKPEVCYASQFGGPDDSKYGHSDARHLGRPVNATDVGIAHRTLPMGSWAWVSYRHHKRPTEPRRLILAQVIDRGPWGRRQADGSWVNGADEYRACKKKHPTWGWSKLLSPQCYSPGSRWRGCIDLTPRAAELLGHTGWGKVKVWRIRKW